MQNLTMLELKTIFGGTCALLADSPCLEGVIADDLFEDVALPLYPIKKTPALLNAADAYAPQQPEQYYPPKAEYVLL